MKFSLVSSIFSSGIFSDDLNFSFMPLVFLTCLVISGYLFICSPERLISQHGFSLLVSRWSVFFFLFSPRWLSSGGLCGLGTQCSLRVCRWGASRPSKCQNEDGFFFYSGDIFCTQEGLAFPSFSKENLCGVLPGFLPAISGPSAGLRKYGEVRRGVTCAF